MRNVNKVRFLSVLAILACIIVLCWAAWNYGKMHVISDSIIYAENGYFVIAVDGEEWLNLNRY